MNKHSPLGQSGSLLERAAALYGLEVPTARAGAATVAPRAAPRPEPQPEPQPQARPEPRPEPEALVRPQQAPRPLPSQRLAAVDRARLRKQGFLDPDAPAGALAEEFRIVKRQLLATAALPGIPEEKRRIALICSAQPDEGKTFCALNLALSLAGEQDVEVLLIDGDFGKPEILPMLGVEPQAGFVDAIADPALDPEGLIVRTDVGALSLLGAGRQVNNVTELLASERTREVLARLAGANPKRILIFDSPPALAASSASVLASHAGQTVMVVRADQTAEADLREALDLLAPCPHVSLLLNGAGFAASGRRFGSYYGYGQ
ncbi:MAG: protein-tyrosine kinase [Sphingomonadales bacterium]|jgi:exopolysaccharide/PEP-CTERM locus tyrosine autokinase|nr:protein-tyrosine kinase [Sphingomonadales bacterium]